DALAPATEQIYDDHASLLEALVRYLDDPAQIVAGEWQFHYGDAPMYGPAFDLRYWQITGDDTYRDRAIAALEVDLATVQDATGNLAMAVDDMERLAMSLLGLIEGGRFLDDARYQAGASALIDDLDAFVMLFNDYLEIDAGMFAANTYGPTSISTFLA